MWNNIPDWAQSVLQSLLKTMEFKDRDTYLHLLRVGQQSRAFGDFIGLNEYQIHVLEYAGVLHDIGKLSIPDHVLFKTNKLTDDEFELIKDHPTKSHDIIKPYFKHQFFKDVDQGVLFHHERIDGTGYPYKLKGDDIPLTARVVCIIDAVDAMRSRRPYKERYDDRYVLKELKRCAGTQFDQELVKEYLKYHKFLNKKGSLNTKLEKLNFTELMLKKAA